MVAYCCGALGVNARPHISRECDRYLVNPSQFSQFGIEDEEFFMARGKAELLELFASIGHIFSPEVRKNIAQLVGQGDLLRARQCATSLLSW